MFSLAGCDLSPTIYQNKNGQARKKSRMPVSVRANLGLSRLLNRFAAIRIEDQAAIVPLFAEIEHLADGACDRVE